MWIILVSLAIGIIIGLFRFLPDKFMKSNLRFQQAGVILLIFSMGASIGANKELIGSIRSIGIKALTFALLTCFLSTAIVYAVSKRYMGRTEKE